MRPFWPVRLTSLILVTAFRRGGLLAVLVTAAVFSACGTEPDASLGDDVRPADAGTLPVEPVATWVRTRQREAGPGYAFTRDPRGGWLAVQPHVARDLRVVGDAVVLGDGADAAQLRVGGIGRAGNMVDVPVADVAVRENRAARAWGGSEVWYLNGPLGLEQGLTLDHRVAGDDELVVRVDVTGAEVVPLYASQDSPDADRQEAREIEVRSANLAVRYHTIFATDASGRFLPAHFEVRGTAIELHVDDAGATYPLEIDPLIVTVQKLVSPDVATSDHAGRSVAVSGDYALVGAPEDDDKGTNAGAAYLFRRSGAAWSQVAKLVAPDGAAGDDFGRAVAITAGDLVVGAPNDDGHRGAVYLWSLSGMTWSYVTKLVPSLVANDRVGASVGIDGTTLVIGAPGNDETSRANCGAAYVYRRAGSWAWQAKLVPSALAAGDEFGASVAVAGRQFVGGAPGDDGGMGAVYAYMRMGTAWNEASAPLLPTVPIPAAPFVMSDRAARDRFGAAVSLSGNALAAVAVIGAPHNNDTVPDPRSSGSAYVFVFGASWTQQRKFVASDPAPDRHFGVSVGISDLSATHLVIGSDTANGAYVARRTPAGVWPTAVTKIFSTDLAAGDLFGQSVAISGTTLVVGAPSDDWPPRTPGATPLTSDAGSAYAFTFATSWTQQARLAATDGSEDDQLGASAYIDGTTAILGAPFDDDAGTDSGAAYVFTKSGGVWSLQQKILPIGGATGERFGFDVAVSGNVAVIGAPYASDSFAGSGAVYVYTRAAGVWTRTQRFKFELGGAAAGDAFGWAVAVDGNTFAAAAPLDDNARGSNSGSIAMYDTSGGSWARRSTLAGADSAANDWTGYSLALEGDRLVAGSPQNDTGGTNAGALYVYSRLAFGSGWTQLGAKIVNPDLTPAAASDTMGWDVSYAGGVLVAGAPGDAANGSAAGAVFTFSGPTTFAFLAKITALDGMPGDAFGTSIGPPVSLSGAATLIVGAPGDDANRGSAYVYQLNGAAWLLQQNKLFASDGAVNTYFGRAVALEGRDALVGAYFSSSPDYHSGAAYAHYVTGLIGDVCSTAAVCGSGFCVDGACCNTACGGGMTNDCQACSAAAGAAVSGTCGALSAVVAPTVVCRPSVSVCDVDDMCAAASTSCPADLYAAATTLCRVVAGACDLPESCDGTTSVCPTDLKRPSTDVCRPAALTSACDRPDLCAGGDDCPTDAPYAPSDNIVCRAGADVCDVAERCAGAFDCPVDIYASGTSCREVVGPCDVAETCAGTSAACPVDIFSPTSVVCRAVAGPCDVSEQCTGMSAACPAIDAFLSSSTCRVAQDVCDAAETCDGSSASCPIDVYAGPTTVCRPSAGLCDAADTCSGSSISCPADGIAAEGAICADATSLVCDAPDVCDGVATNCPDNRFLGTSECRDRPGLIALGRRHSCHIDDAGSLRCWGANESGQVGDGTTAMARTATLIGGSWSRIAAGAFHTCGITTTGVVKCWGRNDRGQLGQLLGTGTATSPMTVPLGDVTALELAVGNFHSCAVVSVGTGTQLTCWGANGFGQLGRGGSLLDDDPTPVPVLLAAAPVTVVAGASHTCVKEFGGSVECFGSNTTGQLGSGAGPATSFSATPVAVTGLPPTGAFDLAAGGPRTCAVIRQHRLVCWGSNASVRAGDALGYSAIPVDLGMNGIGEVTLGESHVCVRRTDGTAVCWGDNDFGQLGNLTTGSSWLAPTTDIAASPGVAQTEVIQVVAGHQHSCFLLWTGVTSAAELRCWGRGEEGQLGTGDDLDRTRYSATVEYPPATERPSQLGVGWTHSCATHVDGSITCWGDNRDGEGAGPIDVLFSPFSFVTPVTGPDDVRSGEGFSCVFGNMSGGGRGVACWGRNDRGQLGNPANTTDVNSTPTLVPGLSAVDAMGLGLAHACALGTMGGQRGVWCWGANGQGQLGDGTLLDRRTPVRVAIPLDPGEQVRELGAGEAHTCARVSTDPTDTLDIGRVFCWGRNAEGQIGDSTFLGDDVVIPVPPDVDMGVVTSETTASRLEPTAVFGITTAMQLRVGRRHSCISVGFVVGTDRGRDVRCWGLNEHGQLGDGTRTNRAVPVVAINQLSLAAFGGVIDVTAGGAHSCAVVSVPGSGDVETGTLFCWGRNDASQLGDLGTTDRLTPYTVAAAQATKVKRVSAGLDHTCVVMQTGDASTRIVRCWGRNEFGQTGTRGFRANRVVPTAVRFVP